MSIIALGNNRYRCDICGLTITATVLPVVCCTAGQSMQRGPGDFLRDSIRYWLRQSPGGDDCQDDGVASRAEVGTGENGGNAYARV